MLTNLKSAFLGVFFTLLLTSAFQAQATHIRAGEICAVRISQSTLTYRFTLTIYTDLESDVDVTTGGSATFRFGDGTEYVGPEEIAANAESFTETTLNDEVGIVTIVFVHRYQSAGVFVVSYTEQNRNQGIVNIDNSIETPFHIQTIVRIDPNLSPNSSPKLTIPPIDKACIGKAFFHNPGAYDPNADSLAFKLVTPQAGPGADVGVFTALDDPGITGQREDGGTPGRYEIDPVTGTFIWDAPQRAGEYNIAFIVEEWRFDETAQKWELLGFVTRDMQIIVEDCDNERPELEIPEDICVEAGTLIEEVIIGSDPDNDPILVEAFGGPFRNSGSQATLTPSSADGFQNSPHTFQFRWQTDFSHIQDTDHQVQLKITDNPEGPNRGPSLTDFATWNIRVVAPAPTGLNGGLISARSIQLIWDEYVAANFAPLMQVWRRVDSYDFDPSDCNVGIPANSGYELIRELPIDQRNIIDDQNLSPGATYCYRLVAEFPAPKGGTSYASQEFCITIPIDNVLITNVSVLETDENNGEIEVRWNSPLEIDQTLFPPPYRYELVRYTGLSGSANGTSIVTTSDTSFVDTNLNTRDTPYHYEVRLFSESAPDDLIGTSDPASSVRLEAVSVIDEIEINWRASVPWSNRVEEAPYHYIYRNRTDAAATEEDNFVLIDSINSQQSGFIFTDDGSFNNNDLIADLEYCYFITTQGSYGNELIPSPLLNNSQIICALPGDMTPPIDPIITIDPDVTDTVVVDGFPMLLLEAENCQDVYAEACNFSDFSNTLNWTSSSTDTDIASYNVYFSATGEESSFELIANTRETTFEHTGLSSFKGCYRISAVDRSNNESGLSQAVCFENCPNYRLPNSFTPNADGVNDTFMAFNQPNSECPRFVEQVEFQVFSRWGGSELYSSSTCGMVEPDFFINWDGKDSNGKDVPAGTYYYKVTVTFDVFDPEKKTKEFKNWVQIIR